MGRFSERLTIAAENAERLAGALASIPQGNATAAPDGGAGGGGGVTFVTNVSLPRISSGAGGSGGGGLTMSSGGGGGGGGNAYAKPKQRTAREMQQLAAFLAQALEANGLSVRTGAAG